MRRQKNRQLYRGNLHAARLASAMVASRDQHPTSDLRLREKYDFDTFANAAAIYDHYSRLDVEPARSDRHAAPVGIDVGTNTLKCGTHAKALVVANE